MPWPQSPCRLNYLEYWKQVLDLSPPNPILNKMQQNIPLMEDIKEKMRGKLAELANYVYGPVNPDPFLFDKEHLSYMEKSIKCLFNAKKKSEYLKALSVPIHHTLPVLKSKEQLIPIIPIVDLNAFTQAFLAYAEKLMANYEMKLEGSRYLASDFAYDTVTHIPPTFFFPDEVSLLTFIESHYHSTMLLVESSVNVQAILKKLWPSQPFSQNVSLELEVEKEIVSENLLEVLEPPAPVAIPKPERAKRKKTAPRETETIEPENEEKKKKRKVPTAASTSASQFFSKPIKEPKIAVASEPAMKASGASQNSSHLIKLLSRRGGSSKLKSMQSTQPNLQVLGFKEKDIQYIAKTKSFDVRVLQAIEQHHSALRSLKYTNEHILNISPFPNASKTLAEIAKEMKKLMEYGFKATDIVRVVRFQHGWNNLNALLENLEILHSIGYQKDDILKIICFETGSYNLNAVCVHADVLKQAGCSKDEIIKQVSCEKGNLKIESIAEHYRLSESEVNSMIP